MSRSFGIKSEVVNHLATLRVFYICQLCLDLIKFIYLKKEAIMFAVVRHYHFKPEDGNKIDKLIQEGFVPLIKKAKGFIRYYWLDTGAGEGASLSVFQDKAGADESIRLAADFVK